MLITSAAVGALICCATLAASDTAPRPRPFDSAVNEEVIAYRDAQAQELSAQVDVERDIVFGETDEKTLLMDIYAPKEPAEEPLPCVMWIHGGGLRGLTKDYELIQWAAAHTARAGFVSASVDYRLVPEADLPAAIEDVKQAVRFLRTHAADYNIDPRRIAVAGESSGGYLAAFVAFTGDEDDFHSGKWPEASSAVDCAAVWYPHIWGKINPLDYISEGDPPVLFLHGNSDTVVPIEHTWLYLKSCEAKDIEANLLTIGNAEHGFYDKHGRVDAYARHMETALAATVHFLRAQLEEGT